MMGLVHVKVCLYMINHLAESLGERAEKLQVALLEPCPLNIRQEERCPSNETKSLP